jgi:hypothetical protein
MASRFAGGRKAAGGPGRETRQVMETGVQILVAFGIGWAMGMGTLFLHLHCQRRLRTRHEWFSDPAVHQRHPERTARYWLGRALDKEVEFFEHLEGR